MSPVVELLYARRVPHAALALISLAIAGCSSDMSTRMQALGAPFGSHPDTTGSVAQAGRQDPPQSAGVSPAVTAPQSYQMASATGVAGALPPQSEGAGEPGGGIHIIVGTSDTLEVLAHRYHVTPAAILAANGYKGPRTLSPGQSLVIPRQTAAHSPDHPKKDKVADASSVHVVRHGDTLRSIARRNHVSERELAQANKLKPGAKLKLGTRLTVPTKVTAAPPAAPAPEPQPVAAVPAAPRIMATAAPQSARLAQASPAARDSAPVAPAKLSEAPGALPTFRWPVRGKVITAYGAKTNGKSNDGINLAVPEGTPVKAAEDGVVAYSGNELKGYGNLVLLRHANGYVTAYAHASEVLVKRGDTIKRGQVIAKSGQSGEVTSPQLHFEIRKGSTPVDPLQFLNGA